MGHLHRYDRPLWATGLFIALVYIVAAAGGIVNFVEGKKVKRTEGVTKTRGAVAHNLENVAREEAPSSHSRCESSSVLKPA